MRKDLQAQLIKELVLESNEALDQFDQELLALEKSEASDETMNVMFRAIHTLKGSGGCLGLAQIESLAHAGESLMSLLRDREIEITPRIITVLLACSDALRAMLSNLQINGVEGVHDNSRLITDLKLLSELQTPEEKIEPEGYGLFDWSPAEAESGTPVQLLPPELLPNGKEEELKPLDQPRVLPAAASTSEGAIRVDVEQLDGLMDLVGELVLARNQILQFTGKLKDARLVGATQRLNIITTKLQETVMKTRMQPIGNVWNKFPRIVRDIARDLEKQVRLEMEGKDTDLDRNIIEAIKDPLTHLIRNSVDHGLELPARRIAAGKPAEGLVRLRAFHEGGQVNIEIFDDGAGIDRDKVLRKAIDKRLISQSAAADLSDREVYALLFSPGFSTAEKVTNLSGRGVGLDVVRNNVERIGGSVNIQSDVGKSTTIRIRIPLTLAIIPALIINSGGHRYAIPQVNLIELVRIDADQSSRLIEYIGGSPVYRLRGSLLPLVYLSEQLQVPSTARNVGDSIFLLVLQAETRQFGLVVDGINDTEEIVVKPLGKELKSLTMYAGATIMGDGCVSLILDVLGLARRAGVVGGSEKTETGSLVGAQEKVSGTQTRSSMLLFSLGKDRQAAIPLSHVSRLEEFDRSLIESGCDSDVIQYRGEIMPLISLMDVLGLQSDVVDTGNRVRVIVYSHRGKRVGFIVDRIIDTVHDEVDLQKTSSRPGILGSAVIRKRVTDFIDTEAVIQRSGVVCFEGAIA